MKLQSQLLDLSLLYSRTGFSGLHCIWRADEAKVLADDVARKCVGSVLNVTKAENKEKSEKPPALYDLTSLQRDANRVLGFTAQQTLDYTQSLYEKNWSLIPVLTAVI